MYHFGSDSQIQNKTASQSPAIVQSTRTYTTTRVQYTTGNSNSNSIKQQPTARSSFMPYRQSVFMTKFIYRLVLVRQTQCETFHLDFEIQRSWTCPLILSGANKIIFQFILIFYFSVSFWSVQN